MAKKKQVEETVTGPLEGTVEHARQQHFEKEKAAYEERTGEKVNFEPGAPMTSTPLPAEPAVETDEQAADSSTDENDSAEGEGSN